MKNFKTHFIKYDFKLTTGNLNNLKKFEFSKNEKFQSPPYRETKETPKT